jgi:hypothetical protein
MAPEGGSLADLPDIEADRGSWNTLGWELEFGDAVFFHMLTLHASSGGGNGVGGRFSCASSAMTCGTHRGPGEPRRSFPGWSTSSLTEHR